MSNARGTKRLQASGHASEPPRKIQRSTRIKTEHEERTTNLLQDERAANSEEPSKSSQTRSPATPKTRTSRKKTKVVPKKEEEAPVLVTAPDNVEEEEAADDSDYVDESESNAEARTPRKRGATSQNSSPRKKSATPKKKKGREKTPVPLDSLTPKELLALAKKDHQLAETLSSTAGVAIWSKARSNVKPRPVPDPPRYCSEEKWAQLLFDERLCQGCSQRKSTEAELFLEFPTRLCARCREETLIKKQEITNLNEVDKLDDWFTGKLLNRHESKEKTNRLRYWKREADEVSTRLLSYTAGLIRRDPNVRAEFEAYKTQRRSFVDHMKRNLWNRKSWYDQYKAHEKTNMEERRRARLSAIRARFKQLGYTDDDVSVFTEDHKDIKTGPVEITDKEWEKLEVRLGPTACLARKKRLLNSRYDEFKAALVAEKRPVGLHFYPTLSELLQHQPLKDLIDAAREDFDNRLAKATNFASFARLVDACILQKRGALENQIRGAFTAPLGVDVSKLAARVFTCNNPGHVKPVRRPLIGMDMAATHRCSYLGREVARNARRPQYSIPPEACPSLALNVRASDIASQIIDEAGLSPLTATVAQMNALDKRFTCNACLKTETFKQENGHKYKPFLGAYTWRSAIHHAMTKHPKYFNSDPWNSLQFTVITDPVKLQAAKTKLYRSVSWFCNHCTEFNDGYAAREDEAMSHLQTMHGIKDPALKDDLFQDDELSLFYEAPVFIRMLEDPPRRRYPELFVSWYSFFHLDGRREDEDDFQEYGCMICRFLGLPH
ncbi:hypothetical protein CC2G_008555 [Coprinopsis cinerea AmutBmut pab1-1]|nr:hypothetical protein CC2G_008555 [Coprinopsis cinerea AmutBmut pab1-1]